MWIGDTWVDNNNAWKYTPSQIMGANQTVSLASAKKARKTQKRKMKGNNMWKAKSKRLRSFLSNPKNGTTKQRKLARLILSTRTRR